MPDTLRLGDGSYLRRSDVLSIIQHLYALQSVELIGFSNIGKSALLRLLAERDVWTQELGEAGNGVMSVYIDCNRMLDLSDQGFYELILRCLQESYPDLAALPGLQMAYQLLVAPASEFQVPLSFNQGLTAVLDASAARVVLLFDEFDDPFTNIQPRVFLNLRALKDRHAQGLVYMTATDRALVTLRVEDHNAEFCELFSHRAWYLAPLTRPDIERFVHRFSDAQEVRFTSTDVDFICEWAGGHPRLLEGVCRLLEEAIQQHAPSEQESVDRWQLHREVARTLRSDPDLQLECEKIWARCSDAEQNELLHLTSTDYVSQEPVRRELERRHILWRIGEKYRLFARLFSEFVQRMVMQSQTNVTGLTVDVGSGEVLVNGVAVETLTNLEYRLMLLLFQNANKIVDKYEIVTQVWGESYIDEVDDTRIEKLISRLRQKIERDSSSPHYLTTVRGRGYRLLLEQETPSRAHDRR